jgi:hypothetical protein
MATDPAVPACAAAMAGPPAAGAGVPDVTVAAIAGDAALAARSTGTADRCCRATGCVE